MTNSDRMTNSDASDASDVFLGKSLREQDMDKKLKSTSLTSLTREL